MERSNGCTSTANNKANNSSNSQDSSQEAKQKSNANGMNSTGNSRPQDSNIVHEDGEAWLCHHYKRRCFVNFSCCDTTFWPCHRCHNNKSKCGVKRLKSCHTKGIKCASCGEKKEVRFPLSYIIKLILLVHIKTYACIFNGYNLQSFSKNKMNRYGVCVWGEGG